MARRRVRTPGRIAAQNRKARHNYTIAATLEAGIALTGTEVKALRAGQGSIGEAYAGPAAGELYLFNAYIPEYRAARDNHDPRRPRKLLVRRRERDRLLGQVREKGVTLVPLSIYFSHRGLAKVDLALATGKRKYDKRQAEKSRDWQRQKERLERERG